MSNYLGKQKICYMQPRLPYEYQEVEYIESTGTQYIDTSLGFDKSYTYEISVAYTDLNATQYAMGISNIAPYMYVGFSSISYNLFTAYGDVNINGNRIPYAQGDRCDYRLKNGSQLINLTQVSSHTATINGGNIYLFAINDQTNKPVYHSKVKIYFYKVLKDKEIIQYFIPCYRKSDLAIGLFDLVEKKFYENKGTGEFLKGIDATKIIKFKKQPPPRLPYEYQEVEYIESTGTQYINTGVKGTNLSRIILDYQITNIYPSCVFGARTSSTQKMFTYNISGNHFVSGFGDTLATNLLPQDTSRHIVDKNKTNIYIDGILKYTYPSATFTTNLTIDLFAIASEANGGHGYLPCSAKIYSCKIYSNDVLIRDYIPCYRKSDLAIGLFDLVEKKFYENKGTGEFIININFIPSDYQEVEYIESTGTQYIDTGVVPDNTTGVFLSCSVTDVSDGDSLFFGSRQDTTVGRFWSGKNNGFVYSAWDSYITAVGNRPILPINELITIEKNYFNSRKEFYNNIVLAEFNQSLQASSIPMVIFAGNDKGKVQYYSKMKLYKFQITKGLDLVRNFIPCYRKSDNIIGLFDTVNKVFYTNSGTGEFLKGGDI